MHGLNCKRGDQRAVHDLLYFGSAKPDGVVSPQEWDAFLKDTVTPRFPQGLSVWQAAGQWRSADGTILSEPSRVLDLAHPDDALDEQALQEIIGLYKSRFQQESVLRIKAEACVSF